MLVLDSYRKIAIPAEKHRFDVKIQSGHNVVVINRGFRKALDSIGEKVEYCYGSISGIVEDINIPQGNRRFWLYPIIGASRLMATFRARDKDRFAQAVGKYVTLHGRLSYKSWDKYPDSIFVDGLAINDQDLYS
jgi:hypothetical protein